MEKILVKMKSGEEFEYEYKENDVRFNREMTEVYEEKTGNKRLIAPTENIEYIAFG